jgi:putative transposase
MPRKARIDAAGALHHIICRGIEGQRVFRDDKDRDNFVKRLDKILEDSSTPCYAWALIPNHILSAAQNRQPSSCQSHAAASDRICCLL